MKEINGYKYFNLEEVLEKFQEFLTEKDLLNYLKGGRITGKKLAGKWHIQANELPNLENIVIKENMHSIKEHFIDLESESFRENGRILDIGGGGEGIIGQHLGDRVVSIDNQKDEFEEAIQNGDKNSLKIIMDARDLKFLSESFKSVVAFFSLLYISPEDLPIVFNEIHRVLEKGGLFTLWDVVIPKNSEKQKKIYAIPLKIKINGREVQTSYGTSWDKEQNLETYEQLGKKANFQIINKVRKDKIFKITMKK